NIGQRFVVALRGCNETAVRCRPYLRGSIKRSRGNEPAIGTEDRSADTVFMTREHFELGSIRFPQESGIVESGEDKFAVRAEGSAPQDSVRLEKSALDTGRHIPKAGGSRAGDRGHELAVRAELDPDGG